MKRKEKLKKFARKAFPIIGISAISATFALALNAIVKKKDCCSNLQRIKARIEDLEDHYIGHAHDERPSQYPENFDPYYAESNN